MDACQTVAVREAAVSGTPSNFEAVNGRRPVLAIGGSASGSATEWGQGETTTSKIGRIDSGYVQMVASGTRVFEQTGAKVFNINAGDISKASAAQIGRVINGTVITADIVDDNLRILKSVGTYCRDNGIGVIIEIQADNSPEKDWTYQVAPVAKMAGLPVVGIENDNEPEVQAPSSTFAQRAQWTARIVQQYTTLFPNLTFGNWVGGDLNAATAWWKAYNEVAASLGLPKLSYAVADIGWNTPWLQSPALWKNWLSALADRLNENDMSLKVLTDGINTNVTPEQWTAQAEQHMAMLGGVQGLRIDTILVRTWQANQPTAVGPVNDPASLGGAAAAISAMYPLYQGGLITARGNAEVYGQPQVVVMPGRPTPVSRLRVTVDRDDIATGTRVGVHLAVNSGTLTIDTVPGVVVYGNRTSTLTLAGTQAQVNSALASLTVTMGAEGIDSLAVKVFNAAGRIDNYQTTVVSTARDPSTTGGLVTFKSVPGPSGLTTAWTSASATIDSSSIIRSISLDWNTTVAGGPANAFQQIKQLSLHLPMSQSDVTLMGGVPRARGADTPGNNTLSNAAWKRDVYNPSKALVQVDVRHTDMQFNSASGSLDFTKDYFAPVLPAKVMVEGSYQNYLGDGAYQVTYTNNGNNPYWRPEWGYEFGSVKVTVGSQGQTLERVYQGTEQYSFRTVIQVFNPYTGSLWEQIYSDSPPSEFKKFMTGRMYITQVNTGDNPNWNYADWSTQRQVTTTWQDYYVLKTETAPPPPVLTVISGAQFLGGSGWYSEPGAELVFRGMGVPGNTVKVLLNGSVVQEGIVGVDGWWNLAVRGNAGSGAVTVTGHQGGNSSQPGVAGFLQIGPRFSGTAGLFSSYINEVTRLRGMGIIQDVSLSDRQAARIEIDVARWNEAASVLALIKTPYQVHLTGVAARNADSLLQTTGAATASISDTCGNIREGLATLQRLVKADRLSAIYITDPDDQKIRLRLSVFQSNMSVFNKISNNYILSLTDISAQKAGISEISGFVAQVRQQDDSTQVILDDRAGIETWSRSTLTFTNTGRLNEVYQEYDANAGISSKRYVFDSEQRLVEAWSTFRSGGYTLTRFDAANLKPWTTVEQTVVAGNRLETLLFKMDTGCDYETRREVFDDKGRLSVRSDIVWNGAQIITEFDTLGRETWSQVERRFTADGVLTQETYTQRPSQEYSVLRRAYDTASFITSDAITLRSGTQLRVLFVKDGNASRVGTIQYLDGRSRVISETVTQSVGGQVTANANLFDTRTGQVIARSSALSAGFVVGVLITDAVAISKQSSISGFEVRDAPNVILGALRTLTELSNTGKLFAVTLSPSESAAFSLTGRDATAYQGVLQIMRGLGRIDIIEATVGQATQLTSQTWATRVSVTDSWSNLTGGMSDLLSIAKAGKLGDIVVSAGTVSPMTISQSDIVKSVPVLSRIQGSWQLRIDGLTAYGTKLGSISGYFDKITQTTDGRVQLMMRPVSVSEEWSKVVVDWAVGGTIKQMVVTWSAGGSNMSSRFVMDSSGNVIERWDSPRTGGYILTRQDTASTALITKSVMTVDNRNQMIALEQWRQNGTEVWAFHDRDTTKSHHVVDVSGDKATIRVTNLTGGVYSSNVVPSAAVKHFIPSQGMHFIYQNTNGTVAAGTPNADYFVMGYEKISDQKITRIGGFDPRQDIVGLPLGQYGDWAQIQPRVSPMGRDTMIRSVDGKDAIVLDGVDYRSVSSQNFLGI